jgi:hypothetical protein
MAKTVEEVKAYVIRKLGGGIEDVELTTEQMNDVIDDTNRWYSFRAGQKVIVRLQGVQGKVWYELPEFVIEVLTVRTTSNSFSADALGSDDFSYAYGFMFGSWYAGGNNTGGTNYSQSPYPYSDLVQRLQFLETIGRIWGGDPEWDWRPGSRELHIAPGSTLEGDIVVDCFTRDIQPQHLDPEGEDFYLRWAVAEAMETLGEIRRKYDSYPTVGGDRGMNGEALLADSRDRKEKLELQVLNRIRSTPIVLG